MTTTIRPRPPVAAAPAAPKPELFAILHPHGNDYASWAAHRAAANLAASRHFNLSDCDDIEQDLIVRLLESWPNFDPVKSSAKTFIATVVRNGVSKLIRRRQLEQRMFVDAESLPVVEEPSHENDVDLGIDVAAVLARLPPEDRDLAERLIDNSMAEIALQDGVAYATVHKRVQRLREYFEAAGLSLEA